ncbi:MAG: TonB-dependent receptor plug domain-containing protein [Woeseiaceae bacterium]
MTGMAPAKPTLVRRLETAGILMSLAVLCIGQLQADEIDSSDLADLSLDELLSTEITTLSRKAENLSSAPAAVHVISQSDIRRSGARSIPELLRMVPGMQVAQIDGNKWAVTSRGANGRFANKLLVLMDGRSLYNPMLSGVQWDMQDTDIAAIERIEVIRGPGATMWGSNAVNGVVNIITKHAADTQGGNVSVLGAMDGYETVLRYGAKAGDTAFRVFGKFLDRDGNVNLAGQNTEDYAEMARVGGRFDWDGDERNAVTLGFEAYSGDSGDYRISRTPIPPFESIIDATTEITGAFLAASWSRDLGNDSGLAIRAYFDKHERDGVTYTEDVDSVDLDIQHGFKIGEGHDFMWGVNYRSSSDETTNTFEISILPNNASRKKISAFVQDEFSLFDGKARIMLGSKFEHNDFSDEDLEIEPSARISVSVGDNKTVWGSISNSVRTPSRGEQGGRVVSSILPPGSPELPLPVPAVAVVIGNPNMKSEDVTAYEFGFRMHDRGFEFDAAFFYNQFTNLRSLAPGAPICIPSGIMLIVDPNCLASSPYVELPLFIDNNSEFDTYGVEMWLSKQLSERWRVQGSYTYITETNDNSAGTGSELDVVEDSPDHQISVRSSTDISESLEFDVWVRWVDQLDAQQIDAYTAVDLRFAWSPMPTLSVAAVGKNLLAGDHLEFMSELVDLAPVQIESSGFLELRWQF